MRTVMCLGHRCRCGSLCVIDVYRCGGACTVRCVVAYMYNARVYVCGEKNESQVYP